MSRRQKVMIVLFTVFVLFLLFAPRQSILKTDVLHTYEGPSRAHLLGTDNLGRDVWSLLLAGGARTLEVVFLAGGISFFAGTTLGMIAAFQGKAVRGIIQLAADFTLVVPSFIMAMVFSALFGFSPAGAGVIFGIGNMGQYVNQAYDLSEGLKSREFIDAERVVGLGKWRLLFFHVLPNIYRQLLVFLGNRAAGVVVQYAGLAFIGLGTDITNPDWGTLLYQYRAYLTTDPALVLYPTAAIAVLVLFFHFMFDSTGGREEAETIYD